MRPLVVRLVEGVPVASSTRKTCPSSLRAWQSSCRRSQVIPRRWLRSVGSSVQGAAAGRPPTPSRRWRRPSALPSASFATREVAGNFARSSAGRAGTSPRTQWMSGRTRPPTCHELPVDSHATVPRSQRPSPRSTTVPVGRRSIGSRRECPSQRCEVGGPVSGGRPEPVAQLRPQGRCRAVRYRGVASQGTWCSWFPRWRARDPGRVRHPDLGTNAQRHARAEDAQALRLALRPSHRADPRPAPAPSDPAGDDLALAGRPARRRRWTYRGPPRPRSTRFPPSTRRRGRAHRRQPRPAGPSRSAPTPQGDPTARPGRRRADARGSRPARRHAVLRPGLRRPPARRGPRAPVGRHPRQHAAHRARAVARRGRRHQDDRAPHGPAPRATQVRSHRVASRLRSPAGEHARVPQPPRRTLDRARLPVLAPPLFRRRAHGSTDRPGHALHAAPQLREPAPARRPQRHLRRAPARSRRPLDAHALRPRHR
ncbi:hypothetical protein DSM104299_05473 [Baekduia alba]|nr:hypothetical protein DSM104299_05473 [Baekduia alba]